MYCNYNRTNTNKQNTNNDQSHYVFCFWIFQNKFEVVTDGGSIFLYERSNDNSPKTQIFAKTNPKTCMNQPMDWQKRNYNTFEDSYCSLNRASKKIKIHIDIVGVAAKLSSQRGQQTMTVHSCLERSLDKLVRGGICF